MFLCGFSEQPNTLLIHIGDCALLCRVLISLWYIEEPCHLEHDVLSVKMCKLCGAPLEAVKPALRPLRDFAKNLVNHQS